MFFSRWNVFLQLMEENKIGNKYHVDILIQIIKFPMEKKLKTFNWNEIISVLVNILKKCSNLDESANINISDLFFASNVIFFIFRILITTENTKYICQITVREIWHFGNNDFVNEICIYYSIL